MADDKKAKKDEKPKDDAPKDDKAAGKDGEEKKEGEEGAAEAPAGGLSKKKKIILFAVLPLTLLIVVGSAAYFTGMLDGLLGHKKELKCDDVKEGDKDFAACQVLAEASASNRPGTFVNIPDMIVNLNSSSKQPRFLKVVLKLELDTAEDQKRLDPMMPRVVDQFQMYLRELRVEDLRGTSGVYRMKIELLSRVRAAVPSVKVRDVLFQEILVQ